MSQRNILIVAAERGLGLGLAEEFFGRGWGVVGTARAGADTDALRDVAAADPAWLSVAYIDVTDAGQVGPFLASLGGRRFDVVYLNAGIYGPLHQSTLEATPQQVTEVMMTNAFGPARLARRPVDHLAPRGTLAFMSSHRASIAGNVEGGLDLYRASKAALNMLARGIYADLKPAGHTVLNVHPGWVNTDVGTLGGTVAAEIELGPSVRGAADMVERHMGSGRHLYVDYQGRPLDW